MGEQDDLLLWFDHPAAAWVEAVALGNGRLGAMVFGGLASERLALNEDTLWSGAPRAWDNPRAREVLPEVRRLLAALSCSSRGFGIGHDEGITCVHYAMT